MSASHSGRAQIILEVSGLRKQYGSVRAVRGVSFEVCRGEIMVLLGPSGCGKSTILRLVAGLEHPDGGTVRLKGETIVDADRGVFVPSEKRNMGMVFQSYAVWPHMTVAAHVAFPLELRRYSRAEIRQRVSQILNFVNLDGMEERLATQLSGGQQQRLALARAMVYDPDILLLDEPLSNLDAKLRQQMRVELKKLQQRLGTTFIFVTHDQVEAMTLAHRVAVMNDGQIEQVGTPEELYEQPASPFAHSFLGTTIRLEGLWRQDPAGGFVELAGGFRVKPESAGTSNNFGRNGDTVLVTLRPDELTIVTDEREPAENEFRAAIQSLIYLGNQYEISLLGGGAEFVIQTRDRPGVSKDHLLLRVDPRRVRIWPV